MGGKDAEDPPSLTRVRGCPSAPHTEFFAEDGSEVLLPFGGPRGRGALRRDPPIVRDLYVSLEDLFHGCTKKIKISRRVGAVGVKGVDFGVGSALSVGL